MRKADLRRAIPDKADLRGSTYLGVYRYTWLGGAKLGGAPYRTPPRGRMPFFPSAPPSRREFGGCWAVSGP